MSAGSSLWAAEALLPGGWERDTLLRWDATGQLTEVRPGTAAPAGVARAAGPVLPGLPNLHSHAFQRAFAGLTERRGAPQDSFWSWRERMYAFALRITPEQLEAVATALYAEMLEAGYTSVCEFHYLHHDHDGRAYADDAELSRALLRAAQRTGIGLTLLPVLYQSSGFGGAPAGVAQRRFLRSNESLLGLVERLRPGAAAQGARLGLAPHSLRAVPPATLAEAVAGLHAQDAQAPVHIHIAEQTGEVDACLAWSGQRPVAWLLDHAPVDARWCLVHATHLDTSEIARAGATGAVAGLCPTTEANLGDGLFAFEAWRAAGGAWGLGSDSHITVDAAEEVRLLEYGQRLLRRERNLGATTDQPEVATALWCQAVAGGAQAAARPVAGLAPGQQADFVVLDGAHPLIEGLAAADALSVHVFASHRRSALAQTWVAGRCVVDAGAHALGRTSAQALARVRRALLQDHPAA